MINVLLTGAGFTANFGAPLAKDIYNILFNKQEVQDNSKIRELFLFEKNINDSNYEGIYEKIEPKNKSHFDQLLWNVFSEKIDFYAKNPQWKNIKGNKSQEDLLHRFLVKLCYSKYKSIFFTLNQDLFIERQLFKIFSKYSSENVHIAAVLKELSIEQKPEKAMKRLGVCDEIINNQHSDIKDSLRLNIVENLKDAASNMFDNWYAGSSKYTYYVKIHGSLDFFKDNNPLLITGINKGERMDCPLIQYYSKIFQNVLLNDDCKLIIIGYGFKDKHINEKISVFLNRRSSKSEMYIVGGQSMGEFLRDLPSDVPKDKLLEKLKGYYPTGLDSQTLISLLDVISI